MIYSIPQTIIQLLKVPVYIMEWAQSLQLFLLALALYPLSHS